MAQFTRLGNVELAELIDVFDLGALQGVKAIAAGTINSNFVVDTDRGRWFLRINEGKSEPDVAWESQLVHALAERGVITPPPLAARDGRRYAQLPGSDKWVSVFAWRPGHHVRADDVTAAKAGEFGAALADLHRACLELPAAWRRRSIYDHDHLVARFAAIEATGDPALARAIEVLREELAAAAAAASVRDAATRGMIHGDLFRDNVLWDGDRVVAILDFEQASGGSLAYDLAVCINDWCWAPEPGAAGERVMRMDLAAALIAGYQRVRHLTSADRAALLIEARAAAARFTITRITDVYLARVDNPEKDFRDFLARCDAWRGPALGQLTSVL